jgi:hypothetical protein
LGTRFSGGASRLLTGILMILGKIVSYDSRIVIGEHEGAASARCFRGSEREAGV